MSWFTHPPVFSGRRQFDYYPTPTWCTKALLDNMPPKTKIILEPCAGDGAIVRVLKELGYFVIAVEIQEKFREDLECFADVTLIGDFFSISEELNSHLVARPYAVVTNPPFSLAVEFVNHCLNDVNDYTRHPRISQNYRIGRYLAKKPTQASFFLPLSFLASEERSAFHRRHPVNNLCVMANRPSFNQKGIDSRDYAWFTYNQTAPYQPPFIALKRFYELDGDQTWP